MSSWVRVGPLADIDEEDVIGFDHAGRSYAIYRVGRDELWKLVETGPAPRD